MEREASIVSTSESSIAHGYSASNLIDGKGLNGKMSEGFCAHTCPLGNEGGGGREEG